MSNAVHGVAHTSQTMKYFVGQNARISGMPAWMSQTMITEVNNAKSFVETAVKNLLFGVQSILYFEKDIVQGAYEDIRSKFQDYPSA